MHVRIDGKYKEWGNQSFVAQLQVLDNKVVKVSNILHDALYGKTLDYVVQWCNVKGYNCKVFERLRPGEQLF